jgi:Holliday junction resolvasome RuvABC endonuclease subunit
MNILGLDPAVKCGFAHTNGKRGVWNLGSGRPIEVQHVELERLLTKAIAEWGCELLAVEYSSFGSMQPGIQAMHNERLGIIRMIAHKHNAGLVTFSPMTIKAFATGNGHAKKPQMIAACRRLLDLNVVSEDEADAIWIRELARRPDCWPEAKPKSKRRAKPMVKANGMRLF